MRKQKLLYRPLAALLALVLALTMTPAARAAALECAKCHFTNGTVTVLQAATCSQKGTYAYICRNAGCELNGISQLIVGDYDANNHDIIYTANSDGTTHNGVCKIHSDVTVTEEPHTFVNGICDKCGALDYSQVAMSLPDTRTSLAALGDPSAKLSAGDIQMTLGTANVTADYELTYLWFYQNRQVGEGTEYPLPSSVYNNKGIYYYTLIVSAAPKGTLSRQPLTKTCNITLHVEELITASAVVTTQDVFLRLGDSDGLSEEPVSSQIYEQVLAVCGRNASPGYVVFGAQPNDGTGKLQNVTTTNARYYFSGTQNLLDNVEFVPGGAAGEFSMSFTAYDTAGESYAGLLTITVQQYAGDMDVVYATARNAAVTLSAKDFQNFWSRISSNGTLDYITFNELPTAIEGAMYIGYASQAVPGEQLRTSDLLYVNPGVGQFGINATAFVPGVTQNKYVTLGFTAYGSREGRSVSRQGILYIFLNDSGRSGDMEISAANGEASLTAADFQKAYQSATGTAGTNFYIQLAETPASGSLYVGRTASKAGTRLTDTTIRGRTFSCGTGAGETVSSLTYVPGTASTEAIRYVASSAQGEFLYAGWITFTSSGNGTSAAAKMVVAYDVPAAGAAFKSSDFETLPGDSAAKLSLVSFTPPEASAGTLYYGRTSTAAGTAITSSSSWFSVSSASIAGANSMNSVSFVPAAGSSGVVTIPFTALDTTGSKVTGSVQITITSSPAANPGTTTATPAISFPDVPATEWYYTYVADLTSSGVLNGYEDGTFRPSEGVSLGQALKMIMIAAGYPDISGAGSDWAKPFLEQAKADGLMPSGVPEDLDRLVSRYAIAEIAAKALRLNLPAAVTASPFSDMAADYEKAPYVMALYDVKIIEGSEDAATNTMVYMGTMGIRRKEFAAVIWRMQNYVRTGDVNNRGY